MSSKTDDVVRIILVRHGHVEGISPPERFRGRRDVNLSDLGVRQAGVTARRIAQEWQPSMTYTSPLQRCVQTAQAIGAACAIPIETLPDLNDLDYGDWEWSTHAHASEAWPGLYDLWFEAPHLVRFPNGESLQDLVARAANVLRLVIERHPRQTVVVVGHSAGNRAMLLQILDQPLSAYWRLAQDPCSVSELEILENVTTVRRMNETHHLFGDRD
jgi:phosphoserine phosphatase